MQVILTDTEWKYYIDAKRKKTLYSQLLELQYNEDFQLLGTAFEICYRNEVVDSAEDYDDLLIKLAGVFDDVFFSQINKGIKRPDKEFVKQLRAKMRDDITLTKLTRKDYFELYENKKKLDKVPTGQQYKIKFNPTITLI